MSYFFFFLPQPVEKSVPAYFSMHEEADGKGDIEATLRLNFGGLHDWGTSDQSTVLEWDVLRGRRSGVVFQPASHLTTQNHTKHTRNIVNVLPRRT